MADLRNRLRCAFCNRRIFNTDFERGLAEGKQVWEDTMNGPEEHDEYAHTYNCEKVSRRLVAPPAPEGTDA